jgi:hypothetical protein
MIRIGKRIVDEESALAVATGKTFKASVRGMSGKTVIISLSGIPTYERAVKIVRAICQTVEPVDGFKTETAFWLDVMGRAK